MSLPQPKSSRSLFNIPLLLLICKVGALLWRNMTMGISRFSDRLWRVNIYIFHILHINAGG